jgi:glutathione S-transferase
LLLGRGGVDVARWPSLVAYLERMRTRPEVKAAIDHEVGLRKTVTS